MNGQDWHGGKVQCTGNSATHASLNELKKIFDVDVLTLYEWLRA